jgi:hypothetical protein
MPLGGSLACLLAINLGLIIRATPGNVGFFQFVYALTAEQFGIGRPDAIAVSLLIQTLQIIPLTILGVALAPEFIFRRKKSAPTREPSVAEALVPGHLVTPIEVQKLAEETPAVPRRAK